MMEEGQSVDFSDHEREEDTTEEIRDTQTRVLSDDEDYSSDSSEESLTVQANGGEGAQQRGTN